MYGGRTEDLKVIFPSVTVAYLWYSQGIAEDNH